MHKSVVWAFVEKAPELNGHSGSDAGLGMILVYLIVETVKLFIGPSIVAYFKIYFSLIRRPWAVDFFLLEETYN